MKFPKTFRPEKDLEAKMIELSHDQSSIKGTIYKLFNGLQDFQDYEKQWKGNPKDSNITQLISLAHPIWKDLIYEKNHLEYFVKSIKPEHYSDNLGVYISMLTNNMIGHEDSLYFQFETVMNWLGTYLCHGSILLDGPVGSCTGAFMMDGEIDVIGNVKSHTGIFMNKGHIDIEGNAGKYTGYGMKGGKIIIKGSNGSHAGWEMQGGYLELNKGVSTNLGQSMTGGFINVKGDVGTLGAHMMNGGLMIIKGDVGSHFAYNADGGLIRVEGNIGDNIGESMKKGCVIKINGAMGSIHPSCEGDIFLNDEKVWPE